MNNLGLALLVGVVAGLLEWDIYGGIHLKAARPIITGTVMGLALGDLETGLYVGGTLELVYLGNITVGAAIPPDATCGTAIATALCIISGLDREAAVALALPVAVCAQMLQMFMWTLTLPMVISTSSVVYKSGDVLCFSSKDSFLHFWRYSWVRMRSVRLSTICRSGLTHG